MNDRCVYLHVRVSDNKVFYVGKGSVYRAKTTSGRNKHWRNVVGKHGREVIIIRRNLSNEYAYALEQRLISLYKSRGINLVNACDGGKGIPGYKHLPAAKQAMSAKRKGKPHSPEWRAKISAAHRARMQNGAPPPSTFLTEEGRRKLGEAGKRRKNLPKTGSRPVLCVTDNRIFPCIAAAANFYGIDSGNLGKLLHGNPYYHTLQGKQFKWAIPSPPI